MIRSRIYRVLGAAVLLCCSALPGLAQAGTTLRGDVNGDGRVGALDALAVLAYLVGRPLPAGYGVLPAADADGNGQISAFDAAVILGYSVGRDESPYTVGQRIAACTPTLSATTAAPGTMLKLAGMPSDVADSTLTAYVRIPGDTARFAAVAQRDSGSAEVGVVAPVHPRAALQGGPVELVVTGRAANGVAMQCAAVAVQLGALPAAPGTTQQVAQQVSRSMDGVALALGTTTAELASMDPSTLPPALRPLAAAAWALQGPGNANSVQHVLDGTAPVLGGQRIDPQVLDGVMASTGALASLHELADSLAALGPPPAGVSFASLRSIAGAPSGVAAAEGPARSVVPTIATPEQLDYYMKVQADLDRNSAHAQDVLNRLGIAIGLTGALTGPVGAGIAALAGGQMFAMQVVTEQMQHLLPSALDPLRFRPSITTFQEDQTAPAEWNGATLTAHGGTWQLTPGTIVNGVLVGAGGPIARSFERLFKSIQFVQGAAAGALAEYYNQFWGQIAQKLGGKLEGGVLSQGPYDFGPVGIDDPKWVTAFTSTSGVIAVDAANPHVYRPVGAGRTELVVRTRPQWFAGKIGEGRATITVGTIQVAIDPSTGVEVRPGGQRTFTATVSGTQDARVTWSATAGSFSETGGAFATWTAPSAEGTYTLTATSVARADRSASVQVRVVNRVIVTVTPGTANVATGGTLQFTASVEGAANTAVRWAARRGTVTQAGLYTAPRDTGSDEVTARSAQDTTAIAAARIAVRVAAPWTIRLVHPNASGGVVSPNGRYVAVHPNDGSPDVFYVDRAATAYSVSFPGLSNQPRIYDVNDVGETVGSTGGAGGHAFVRELDGTAIDLSARVAPARGSSGRATAGNRVGQVLFYTNQSDVQISHAFVYTPGAGTVEVGAAGGPSIVYADASGLNARGEAMATFHGDGEGPGTGFEGIWRNGTATALPAGYTNRALNNAGRALIYRTGTAEFASWSVGGSLTAIQDPFRQTRTQMLNLTDDDLMVQEVFTGGNRDNTNIVLTRLDGTVVVDVRADFGAQLPAGAAVRAVLDRAAGERAGRVFFTVGAALYLLEPGTPSAASR